MENKIFYILVVALLFLQWFSPLNITKDGVNLFGGGVNYHNTASSTLKVVGTTSTLVYTTTGNEQWICGGFGNATAVAFGENAVTSTWGGSGLSFASSTPVCHGPFHFQGAINAAAVAGTADISVLDFK